MMTSADKIIFFGTPEFALPALQKLKEHGYAVVLVITQADKPVGRKQLLTPPPVKVLGQKLGLKVSQKLSAEEIRESGASLGVLIAYGKIIPKPILDLFPLGIINLHPSLLPKYRGPSPIQAALLNGDKQTGVTLIMLDEQMDHGPIIRSKSVEIRDRDDYHSLAERLSLQAADLLIQALPDYLSGKISPAEQDEKSASYTALVDRTAGKINWEQTASMIERQIRAYAGWPGCYTEIELADQGVKKLKVIAAEVCPSLNKKVKAFRLEDDNFSVQTKINSLKITKLQLEGKKIMAVGDFYRGYSEKLKRII